MSKNNAFPIPKGPYHPSPTRVPPPGTLRNGSPSELLFPSQRALVRSLCIDYTVKESMPGNQNFVDIDIFVQSYGWRIINHLVEDLMITDINYPQSNILIRLDFEPVEGGFGSTYNGQIINVINPNFITMVPWMQGQQNWGSTIDSEIRNRQIYSHLLDPNKKLWGEYNRYRSQKNYSLKFRS